MKHLRIIRNDCGFTMIEALTAGAILTVSLVGLAAFQAVSLSTNSQAKQKTVVTNFGVEMVERIQSNRQRVVDYNNIDTTASTPCPQTTASQRQALADCQQWRTALTASGINGVRGRVTASRIDPDPTTGAPTLNRTNVLVTVTWNASMAGGSSVQSKSATFQTIIAPE